MEAHSSKPESGRVLARRLGVSYSKTLRPAIERGELVAYRVGSRRLLIFPEAASAWIDSHRVRVDSSDIALVERRLRREASRAS